MFSKKCQYALHALALLAKADGRSLTTAEIVLERSLPRKFLEAILCELKEAGLVKSKKGKHGGYVLAKNPGDIFIREVVDVIEGDNWFICAHAQKDRLCKSCSRAGKCLVDIVMHSIRDHAFTWLSTHSIIDLVVDDEAAAPLRLRYIDSLQV